MRCRVCALNVVVNCHCMNRTCMHHFCNIEAGINVDAIFVTGSFCFDHEVLVEWVIVVRLNLLYIHGPVVFGDTLFCRLRQKFEYKWTFQSIAKVESCSFLL